MDFAVSVGNVFSNAGTEMDLFSTTASAVSVDYSGFVVTSTVGSISTGYGTIVTQATFPLGSGSFTVKHAVTLGQNAKFIKCTTTVTNIGASSMADLRMFVGTRDDWIGTSDRNIKERGTLVNNAFQIAAATGVVAPVLKVSSGNEAVLFFSPTAGTNSVYAVCCFFSNAYRTDPTTVVPSTPSATDGSYALSNYVSSLAAGASASFDWYYAAGATNDIASITGAVAGSAAAASNNCNIYRGPTSCTAVQADTPSSAICTRTPI